MGFGRSSKDNERGLLRMNERFCPGLVSNALHGEECSADGGVSLHFLPFFVLLFVFLLFNSFGLKYEFVRSQPGSEDEVFLKEKPDR